MREAGDETQLGLTSRVLRVLLRLQGFFFTMLFVIVVLLFFCLFVLAMPRMPCGILVPQPGIKPVSPAWKHRVLTIGLPGNSRSSGFCTDIAESH